MDLNARIFRVKLPKKYRRDNVALHMTGIFFPTITVRTQNLANKFALTVRNFDILLTVHLSMFILILTNLMHQVG